MKYVAKTVIPPPQHATTDEIRHAGLYGVCSLRFLSRYRPLLCGE